MDKYMDKYTEIIGADALMPGASQQDIEAAIDRLAGQAGCEQIVECLRALKACNTYGALINLRAAIAAANDAQ